MPIQTLPFPEQKIIVYTDSFNTSWRTGSPMIKAFGIWNEEKKAVVNKSVKTEDSLFLTETSCTKIRKQYIFKKLFGHLT
jgi:hypothetical protein